MNARSLSAVPVVQSAPERKRSTKPGSLRADRPSFDGSISAFARKASMSARSLSRVVIMVHVYRYGMGAASGKYHKRGIPVGDSTSFPQAVKISYIPLLTMWNCPRMVNVISSAGRLASIPIRCWSPKTSALLITGGKR